MGACGPCGCSLASGDFCLTSASFRFLELGWFAVGSEGGYKVVVLGLAGAMLVLDDDPFV